MHRSRTDWVETESFIKDRGTERTRSDQRCDGDLSGRSFRLDYSQGKSRGPPWVYFEARTIMSDPSKSVRSGTETGRSGEGERRTVRRGRYG